MHNFIKSITSDINLREILDYKLYKKYCEKFLLKNANFKKNLELKKILLKNTDKVEIIENDNLVLFKTPIENFLEINQKDSIDIDELIDLTISLLNDKYIDSKKNLNFFLNIISSEKNRIMKKNPKIEKIFIDALSNDFICNYSLDDEKIFYRERFSYRLFACIKYFSSILYADTEIKYNLYSNNLPINFLAQDEKTSFIEYVNILPETEIDEINEKINIVVNFKQIDRLVLIGTQRKIRRFLNILDTPGIFIADIFLNFPRKPEFYENIDLIYRNDGNDFFLTQAFKIQWVKSFLTSWDVYGFNLNTIFNLSVKQIELLKDSVLDQNINIEKDLDDLKQKFLNILEKD